MAVSVGSLGFDLRAYSDKVSADVKKGLSTVERSMNSHAKKFGKAGQQMSMAVTAPLAGIGALSFKTFANFEQEMAKVQAVTGATADEFSRLEKLSLKLGSTTRFSASEVAGLQLEFSKLGFTTSEIEKVTGATLALSQASGADLARSAEVAGGVLRGFGIDAADTGRVTDVMAKSFSSSALDMEKFAESMKYVAPVAKEAGVSVEDTSAMLSVLADNMVSGSMAGTSLRRILNEAAKTGKPAGEALQELAEKGLTLADAEDEVGKNAQTALLILTKNMGKMNELSGVYDNAAGSAQAMADIQDRTATGSMKRLSSAWEGLQIAIGSTIAPVLVPAIDKFGELVGKFTEIDPVTQKWIVGLGAAAAAIGPVLMGLGLMAGGIASLAGFMAAAAGAISLPVIAAAAGIALVGAAIYKHRDAIIGAVSTLVKNVKGWWNEWSTSNAGLISKISSSWGTLVSAATKLGQALLTHIVTGWKAVYAELDQILEPMGGVEVAMGKLATVAGEAMNRVIQALTKFVNFAADNIPKVTAVMVAVIGKTSDVVNAFIQMKDGVIKTVTVMVSKVSATFDKLKAKFDQVKGWIGGLDDKFFGLYDAVVGHSYIPDMVDELANEASRLQGQFFKPMSNDLDKSQTDWESAGKNISDSMGDQLANGELSFESFASVAISSLQSVMSEAASSKISGALGSLFGGSSESSGGGFLSSITSGIGSLFGGAFAKGGVAPAGKYSLVGENGPEILAPNRAKRVIPMDDVGGGGGQTITQNFESGIDKAQLAGMLDRAKQEGANLALKLMQKGGSYNDQFRAAI